MSLLSIVLITCALILFSFILIYPYKKLFGKRPQHQFLSSFRTHGFILLLLSILPLMKEHSVGIALTLWFGYVMLVSIILSLIYSYLPKKIFLKVQS